MFIIIVFRLGSGKHSAVYSAAFQQGISHGMRLIASGKVDDFWLFKSILFFVNWILFFNHLYYTADMLRLLLLYLISN